MNYKITGQYARGEEKPIAEFHQLNDANIFLDKKISNDEIQHKKLVYRLYDESELLKKFNNEEISVTYAQYEDGDSDFINPMPFIFNVVMQIANSIERNSIANFNDENDANLFVMGKCETDNTVEENDLFCILKGRILIKTLNKVIITNQKMKSDASEASQSGAIFYPTPTPIRPKPPGVPSDFWVEKDDEGNNK